ncbi:hypothetical protein MNBD_ALPHA04-530 [hydrothermal vent metagenome]|uniref:Uncharacterized protein n=1 Tax=hydrothermal vent metagenome TaxID=652676 RepID=A0A3B0S5D7_9ZZZZ
MSNVKSATRRYTIRVAALMVTYVILLAVAVGFVDTGRVTGLPAYILAVLPALPIIGMFWAIGKFLIEMEDEYLRMLQVRQMIVATCFALAVATVWGFLEEFELVPFVPAYWVTILWFFGLGIGQVVNKITTGDSVFNP